MDDDIVCSIQRCIESVRNVHSRTIRASNNKDGLINLRLSRKIGRLGDERYPDPDVEGYNPKH